MSATATDAHASGRGLSTEDDRHLLACIELSEQARARGNHPFGALLVDEQAAVMLEAENTEVTDGDWTGHAELNLMRAASKRFTRDQLRTCTVYASTEPCAMCSGALFWGNVGRIVFALSGEGLLEVVGDGPDVPVLGITCREVLDRGSHAVEMSGPHREAEARAVHERHGWGPES